jgi:hypothetical protein
VVDDRCAAAVRGAWEEIGERRGGTLLEPGIDWTGLVVEGG